MEWSGEGEDWMRRCITGEGRLRVDPMAMTHAGSFPIASQPFFSPLTGACEIVYLHKQLGGGIGLQVVFSFSGKFSSI